MMDEGIPRISRNHRGGRAPILSAQPASLRRRRRCVMFPT